MNGLWKGGKHGEGTQTTSITDKCHDITIYSAVGLAAGACSGNGILLDISNPVNPVRIAAVSDPNYAFWHSANFNNAGTKVLFTDEWGGGGTAPLPRDRPDELGRGRDLQPVEGQADAGLVLQDAGAADGVRKLRGAQRLAGARFPAATSWCRPGIRAASRWSISPMPRIRSRSPTSIADRWTAPSARMGGQWSTYWYNGYIYGSEIARGVDVFKLVPNKFLTQNEIDAANQVHFDELNVQNQPKIVWPQNLIVAKAYVAQLERSGALGAARLAALKGSDRQGRRAGFHPEGQQRSQGRRKQPPEGRSLCESGHLMCRAFGPWPPFSSRTETRHSEQSAEVHCKAHIQVFTG